MAKVTGEINMNVAMQSTSEEILEKMKATSGAEKVYPTLFVEGVSSKSQTITALDVTGKGKLFYAVCHQTMGSSFKNIKLKVEIDGEVFIYHTYTYTGSGGVPGGVAVSSAEYFYAVDQGQYGEVKFHVAGVPRSTNGNTAWLNYIPKGTNTTSASDPGRFLISPINQFVSFNESLKVTITFTCANANSGEYKIGYSLDE